MDSGFPRRATATCRYRPSRGKPSGRARGSRSTLMPGSRSRGRPGVGRGGEGPRTPSCVRCGGADPDAVEIPEEVMAANDAAAPSEVKAPDEVEAADPSGSVFADGSGSRSRSFAELRESDSPGPPRPASSCCCGALRGNASSAAPTMPSWSRHALRSSTHRIPCSVHTPVGASPSSAPSTSAGSNGPDGTRCSVADSPDGSRPSPSIRDGGRSSTRGSEWRSWASRRSFRSAAHDGAAAQWRETPARVDRADIHRRMTVRSTLRNTRDSQCHFTASASALFSESRPAATRSSGPYV